MRCRQHDCKVSFARTVTMVLVGPCRAAAHRQQHNVTCHQVLHHNFMLDVREERKESMALHL